MSDARVKSGLLVQSIVRRASARGTPATVLQKGDEDAGAVYVKIFRGMGVGCTLLAPTRDPESGQLVWLSVTGDAPTPESEADAYLEREKRIDPDFWVLEIEDRDGWNPFDAD